MIKDVMYLGNHFLLRFPSGTQIFHLRQAALPLTHPRSRVKCPDDDLETHDALRPLVQAGIFLSDDLLPSFTKEYPLGSTHETDESKKQRYHYFMKT